MGFRDTKNIPQEKILELKLSKLERSQAIIKECLFEQYVLRNYIAKMRKQQGDNVDLLDEITNISLTSVKLYLQYQKQLDDQINELIQVKMHKSPRELRIRHENQNKRETLLVVNPYENSSTVIAAVGRFIQKGWRLLWFKEQPLPKGKKYLPQDIAEQDDATEVLYSEISTLKEDDSHNLMYFLVNYHDINIENRDRIMIYYNDLRQSKKELANQKVFIQHVLNANNQLSIFNQAENLVEILQLFTKMSVPYNECKNEVGERITDIAKYQHLLVQHANNVQVDKYRLRAICNEINDYFINNFYGFGETNLQWNILAKKIMLQHKHLLHPETIMKENTMTAPKVEFKEITNPKPKKLNPPKIAHQQPVATFANLFKSSEDNPQRCRLADIRSAAIKSKRIDCRSTQIKRNSF